ncbi:MAG TPA: 3-oxoacyl-ACP synthase [Sphingobacteriaceae bacterium]
MSSIKENLYEQCLRHVRERIKTAEDAIRSAREASESDTKSSAGDKYETSREMLQQEISRNESQLQESRKLLSTLTLLNPHKQYESAAPGALVNTNRGNFFLAISAGRLDHNGKTYFALSGSSPIGLKLKGLKAGDRFTFNQHTYIIESVA